MAKPYQVTMPDGSTRTVLANSQAAANNNAGLPASGAVQQAPTSSPAKVAGSSYTPPTYTPSASTNLPAAADPGGQLFQTKNGPRTTTQMMNELFAVGWDGQGEIKSVYGRTTGGLVTPTTGAVGPAPSPAATPPPAPLAGGGQMTNLDADQMLLNNAEKKAYQEYLNAKLNLDTDQLAFSKATQAFSNEISKAGITGTYQGQQTQAAQQQKFAQDTSVAGLLGTYNGQPTLAAQQQQANITGYDAQGRPTLARQGQEQQTAQSYLSLIAGLRGPADPFQYLKTLQGTPEGIKSIVDAAAGRYIMGNTASGAQAAPASLGALVGAATGAAPGQPNVGTLPISSQIDPQNYARMDPSQKAALWAAYEAGYGPSGAMRPEDAQFAFTQSLPKYTYSPGTTGTIKL